jgi:hypothetical protein
MYDKDMYEAEGDRRKIEREFDSVLKRELNDEQLATLLQLERFGWILRFVRRDREPIPAVLDPDHDCYAVLEPDGSINKDPPLQFRH